MNVSVKDAKELLEELVRRAEAGEHIVVTSNGEKIAEVGAMTVMTVSKPKKSILGALKGKVWMADDFDELGPEWDEYMK
jgi:antitoxin (DNA-binding transcriptional repressor) of toxin-antitoxin stability system